MHIFVLMHQYIMLFISLIIVVKLLLLFHEIKQKMEIGKEKREKNTLSLEDM